MHHQLCIWHCSNANYWSINREFAWIIQLRSCFDALAINEGFALYLAVFSPQICPQICYISCLFTAFKQARFGSWSLTLWLPVDYVFRRHSGASLDGRHEPNITVCTVDQATRRSVLWSPIFIWIVFTTSVPISQKTHCIPITKLVHFFINK